MQPTYMAKYAPGQGFAMALFGMGVMVAAFLKLPLSAIVIATSLTASAGVVTSSERQVHLAIDYRAGCMGGAAGRGSMTIGRAVALCIRNIGGQRAGVRRAQGRLSRTSRRR